MAGSVRRRVALAIGLAAALGGFAIVAGVGRIGAAEGLVPLIGVLALVQGIRAALARSGAEYEGAETPDPETAQDLPAPGEALDEAIDRAIGPRRRNVERREEIRERLESAAVGAIKRRHGCSAAEARERIEAGAWTEDPYAAAFFTGELDAPFRSQVRAFFGGTPRFERRARRAIAAIDRLSEGER